MYVFDIIVRIGSHRLMVVLRQAGKLHLLPPYLAFASLDKKSVKLTLPLGTVRRVERLNARAGIYALSLSVWHGMKIVRAVLLCPVSNLFEVLTTSAASHCTGRAVDFSSSDC